MISDAQMDLILTLAEAVADLADDAGRVADAEQLRELAAVVVAEKERLRP